jgi:hypothetical protein
MDLEVEMKMLKSGQVGRNTLMEEVEGLIAGLDIKHRGKEY